MDYNTDCLDQAQVRSSGLGDVGVRRGSPVFFVILEALGRVCHFGRDVFVGEVLRVLMIFSYVYNEKFWGF